MNLKLINKESLSPFLGSKWGREIRNIDNAMLMKLNYINKLAMQGAQGLFTF